jgi:hypothetical protein
VATILGVFLILFFLLPPLLETTEGVVIGTQIYAWAPKNALKIMGEKNNTNPHPLAPWGVIFRFFEGRV